MFQDSLTNFLQFSLHSRSPKTGSIWSGNVSVFEAFIASQTVTSVGALPPPTR